MVLSKLANFFNKEETTVETVENESTSTNPSASETSSAKESTDESIEVDVEWTPNPNALKFVTSRPVKLEGNSTYRSPMECGENQLANELFKIRGVDQIHFYDNVVTITKFSYQDWDFVEQEAIKSLKENLPQHNPDYYDPDPEAERREALTDELKEIEKILDKTVRPALQGDGGDIQTVSYEDHVLLVQYQGACGTCPSSAAGTLEAIKGILRDEYDPDIEVYIQPEF